MGDIGGFVPGSGALYGALSPLATNRCTLEATSRICRRGHYARGSARAKIVAIKSHFIVFPLSQE
jgi:hypothetical protein